MREDKCFSPPLKFTYVFVLVALLLSIIFIIQTVKGEDPEITRLQIVYYGFQNQGYEMQTRYKFYLNGSLLVANTLGSEFFFPAPKFQPDGEVVVTLSENESHVIQHFHVVSSRNASLTLDLWAYYDFSVAPDRAKISLIGNTTDEDSEVEYEFENPKEKPIQNMTTSYKIGNIVYDWSDLEGATEFTFAVNKLKVKFDYSFNLDPSIVSSVTEETATRFPHQRKIGYAHSRWWVFYDDGVNIVLRSSLDGGATWTEPIEVTASGDGDRFSMHQHGNYFDYAIHANLKYRRGLFNADGTVTYSDSESSPIDSTYSPGVSITVDSSNYPFITYLNGTSDTYMVVKSSFNNGTWATESGYPKNLSTTTGPFWYGQILALSNNQTYALYTRSDNKIYGRLYNGSTWLNEEDATVNTVGTYPFWFSAVQINDDIHLAFNRQFNIHYAKRTGGAWSSDSLIHEARYSPTLTKYGNNIFMFHFDLDETMGVSKYEDGSWSTWLTSSIGKNPSGSLSSIRECANDEIVVIWVSDVPYYVKFDKFSIIEPPIWVPPAAPGEVSPPPTPPEEPLRISIPQLGFWGLVLSVGLIAVGGIAVSVSKGKGSGRRKAYHRSRDVRSRAREKRYDRRRPPRG